MELGGDFSWKTIPDVGGIFWWNFVKIMDSCG